MGATTMESINHKRLITIDQLADMWQVSKSWVYSRTRQTGPGSIPRVKVGKFVRFDLDAVTEWLQRQNEIE